MSTATHAEHHDHGHPTGFMRWLTTTNHKDIGTMYLVFSLVMFFVGGAMALVDPEPASANAGRVLAAFRERGDLVVHVRHQARQGMAIHADVAWGMA